MICTVVISPLAEKQIRKVPPQVKRKLSLWVELVVRDGLEVARTIPGYHDEPLKGTRKGQRSVRLNRAYRAIYVVREEGSLEFVSVEEVNKHEY